MSLAAQPYAPIYRPRPPALTPALVERVDWLLCFASFMMLLVIQWALSLPVGGISTIIVTLFLLPWSVVIVTRQRIVFLNILRNWPLLLLPLLALLSVLWSGYASTTLKYALEYLLTTIVGIVAASCIKPRTLLSALLIALGIVLAISGAINVTKHTDVGLFGSKNYFGLSAAVLIPAGWAVAMDRAQPRIFRIAGMVAIAAAPLLLVQSLSTGALVMSAMTAAAVAGLMVMRYFSPVARVAALVIIGLFLAMVAVVFVFGISFSELLASMGKDVTLTGRTYLWEEAATSIAANPVLGVGYQAFWQIGNWGAEELWKISSVANRTGYHFHDTYLQVGVDLGYVGLTILCWTLLALLWRAARSVLFGAITPEVVFAVYTLILLLLRSPIEVDLFWQFQLPSIILCLAWVYLGGAQGAKPGGSVRRARLRRRSPLLQDAPAAAMRDAGIMGRLPPSRPRLS